MTHPLTFKGIEQMLVATLLTCVCAGVLVSKYEVMGLARGPQGVTCTRLTHSVTYEEKVPRKRDF